MVQFGTLKNPILRALNGWPLLGVSQTRAEDSDRRWMAHSNPSQFPS